MTNSELEDCYDSNVYKKELLDKMGVDIDSPLFRGNLKWSERIRSVCLNQGKPWNDTTKSKLKWHLADCVSKNPATSLNTHKRNSFDAVVKSLELMINY